MKLVGHPAQGRTHTEPRASHCKQSGAGRPIFFFYFTNFSNFCCVKFVLFRPAVLNRFAFFWRRIESESVKFLDKRFTLLKIFTCKSLSLSSNWRRAGLISAFKSASILSGMVGYGLRFSSSIPRTLKNTGDIVPSMIVVKVIMRKITDRHSLLLKQKKRSPRFPWDKAGEGFQRKRRKGTFAQAYNACAFAVKIRHSLRLYGGGQFFFFFIYFVSNKTYQKRL